jgi:hypothetical protein
VTGTRSRPASSRARRWSVSMRAMKRSSSPKLKVLAER